MTCGPLSSPALDGADRAPAAGDGVGVWWQRRGGGAGGRDGRGYRRPGAGRCRGAGVVLEASQRVGGRVRTERDFAAAPVEAGAEFIHGVNAATWDDARAAGLRVQAVSSVRDSWFTLGGNTRWLPAHLLHPGVWPGLTILRALRAAAGSDITAASFLQARGYQGRALELARLTVTAHLPGSTEQVGVAGLAADGVLHLERALNHRVLDGYDLLPRHIAAGLDIRFGRRATVIAWGPSGPSSPSPKAAP